MFSRLRLVLFWNCLSVLAGCSCGGADAVDAGDIIDADTTDAILPPLPECKPETGLAHVEPIWIAGTLGPRAEVGTFGRPDAVFVDNNGVLLAGDEDANYQELHLYDLGSDDPATTADLLTPLLDFGAVPGPAGTGALEFSYISGFAKSPLTGKLFVLEQGNGRIQILRQTADDAEPYYEFDAFFGAFATDRDHPLDGEFVRMQAARFDSLGRLYVSDDAKNNALTARRDIQIFDANLQFVAKFGDASYGELGVDGNLQEPENFVIDEARNRIYVCDESPNNVVAYTFDDHTFVKRFGSSEDTPNGIDIDQYGFIYVIYEGAESFVRIFDPDTLTEIFRFGGQTDANDLTPGYFNTPDTLYIDIERDLLVVADQGHDRIQGFRLSEIQARSCLRSMVLAAPQRMVAGKTTTVRVDLLDRSGAVDRANFHERGSIATFEVDTGNEVSVSPAEIEAFNGMGSATVAIDGTSDVELRVSIGGLVASRTISVLSEPPERSLTGSLGGDDLVWRAEDGVIHLSGNLEVPAGRTLDIGAGTLIMLDGDTNIDVYGAVEAMGEADDPIYFFPTDPAAPWGRIQHQTGSTLGRYAAAIFVGAGAGPETWPSQTYGHCCIPAIYAEDGTIELARALFADAPGKGLTTRYGATAAITDSLFQRLGMAAELRGAGGNVEATNMVGFTGTDESDALYLAEPGTYTVRNVVLAFGDDDGLDTFQAEASLRDCLIYGFGDKGMSIDGKSPVVENCLIADSTYGIVMKDGGADNQVLMHVSNSTIVGNASGGVWVSNQNGPTTTGFPEPVFENTIVWGSPVSFSTDYAPADITVSYSDVEFPIATSGEGTISANPLFLAPARKDFRLCPLSPARTASQTGGAIGFTPWW